MTTGRSCQRENDEVAHASVRLSADNLTRVPRRRIETALLYGDCHRDDIFAVMPRRNGRPLLIAAAGVALVSFANCHKQRPVGNLRPSPTVPDASEQPAVAPAAAPAAAPIDAGLVEPTPEQHPVGNLRPPDYNLVDAGVADAAANPDAAHHPVGNLRPPPADAR
jgi:hypothetical protein